MKLIVSLKCLSSRAIAGQIWHLPKFKNQLFILSGDQTEIYLADEVTPIIDDFGLPWMLAADLLRDFHGIYQDIQRFLHLITYKNNLANIPQKWMNIRPHLQPFYTGITFKEAIDELTLKWDPCGGLDHTEMAKAALKCSGLKDWERLVIARQYFVYDNDISDTYNDYIRFLQNKSMPQFPFEIPAKLEKQMQNCSIRILNFLFDFPKTLMHAIWMGNLSAVKFFLGKMSADQQRKAFTLMNVVQVAELIGWSRLETESPHLLYFFLEKFDQKKGDKLLSLCFGSESNARRLSTLHVWPFFEHFTELLLRISKIGLTDSATGVLLRGLAEDIVFNEEHALIPHLYAFWNALSSVSQQNILAIDPSLKFHTVLYPGSVPHALQLFAKERGHGLM